MIEVDKFLFLSSLETGGLVVGWTSVLLHGFCMIVLGYGMFKFAVTDCDMIFDHVEYLKKKDFEFLHVKLAFVGIGLLVLLIHAACFIVAINLIQGIQTRNLKKILPMMIWKGIMPFFVIIPLLGCIYILIFKLEFEKILAGVAVATVLVYEYTILFSLYNKIDNDLENEKAMIIEEPYQIFIEDTVDTEINDDPGVQS